MTDKNESEKITGVLERTLVAASDFISQNKQWAENARQNWASKEVQAKSVPDASSKEVD